MKIRPGAASALSLFLLLAACLAGPAPGARAAVTYTNREPLWKFKTRGAVTASPALSADGSTLYVGSGDGRFYAIDTFSGESKWTNGLRLPSAITGSAAIDVDGVIYVSAQNNRLYAIEDQIDHGAIKWSYATPGKHAGAPALDEDGTVYFGSTDNHLWALFPDGAFKWLYSATNDVATPVIDSSGTIYVVAGGYVRGVKAADGTELSAYTPGSAIRTVPAVGAGDVLYFGANNGRAYAYDAGAGTNGGALWNFDTLRDIITSPAVGADGQTYFASESSRVYCLDLAGRLVWSVATRSPIHSALSIGADGTVYGGADDGRLYAISPEGKILWTVKTRGAVRSSPAIDALGVVYFGSSDSYIYAVETEAIADSGEPAWGMFRKDAQHTARATECQPFLIEEPHLSNGATSLITTNGQRVSFSVTVRSGSAVAYQWQLDGINITDNPTATNATFVISNAVFANSGRYVVLVSNDCGDLTSAPFELEVHAPPAITSLSSNQMLLGGARLDLSVVASGEGTLAYQWRRGGTNLAGENGTNFTVASVGLGDAGSYTVTVSNQFGVVTSAVVRVTVFDYPLALAFHPLAAGPRHSLAVLSNQTLWGWGLDNFSQVGDNTASPAGTNAVFRDLPRLIGTNGTFTTNAVWLSVSGGSRGSDVSSTQPGGFSAGLQTNGTLWTWGLNDRGQLGLSNAVSPQRFPQQVGTNTDWVQVEAGATHAAALRRDGSIWTWGANQAGQLGVGGTNSSLVPVRVGADSAWVEVRAGGFHTLARRADGTIWSWGGNTNGQLGLGNTTGRNVPTQIGTATDWAALSAGVNHALALKSNGTLWAWGLNKSGQLGTGGTTNSTRPVRVGTGADWALIEAGLAHSLAIKTNGALFAWGGNWFGQLGNGTNGLASNTNSQNRTAPTAIAPGRTWIAVEASSHSLGMTADGGVWAWGLNANGQLGQGTGGDWSNGANSNAPALVVFPSDVRPPGFTLQPTNATVLESNAAAFSITFTGAPQVYVQWYFNSNVLALTSNPTATSTNLVIPAALRTNVGFYHAVITNHFGAATSTVAGLSVSNLEGIVYLPGGGTTNLNGAQIVLQPVSRTAGLSNSVSFSVTAAGSAPLVYRWFFNSNAMDAGANPSAVTSNLTLNNLQPANAGYYHVTVTNGLGAATSVVASLTITNTGGLAYLPGGGTTNYLAPAIMEQPTNQLVLASNAVSFSVSVTGAPPFYYRWYFNSNVIPDLVNESATNSVLGLPAAAGTDAGYYLVVVTNAFGRATSTVAALTVSNEAGYVYLPDGTVTNYLIPRITGQPLSASVMESNAVSFSVTVTGVPPFSFQWLANSNAISPAGNSTATNDTFTLPGAQASNAAYYQVVITNSFGSATSVVVALSVTNLDGVIYLPFGVVTNYSVPRITGQPVSVSALTNTSVTFSVVATGAAPIFYQWRHESNAIAAAANSSAVTASLTLSNVLPGSAGFYDVVVSNAFGVITSAVVSLTVTNGLPDLRPGKAGEVRLGVVVRTASGVAIPVSGAPAGRTLVLEFKAWLSDPEWTPVSTNRSEAGLLQDATAPAGRSRFYRLRLE